MVSDGGRTPYLLVGHGVEPLVLVCGVLQPLLLIEHLRVPLAELLQQPRRPLDVREEKGDRPARKLDHPGHKLMTLSLGDLLWACNHLATTPLLTFPH
jgi:hypothetical protein